MGRTEFLTETDCERALVGRAKAKASTRAKWRSSSSACRRVLEKCLTPPTLLEMAMFQQLRLQTPAIANDRLWVGRSPGPRNGSPRPQGWMGTFNPSNHALCPHLA